MNNLNNLEKLALYIGKTLIFLTKLTKISQGTNLPGKVSLKLAPALFQKLSKDKAIIAISGTNGKSTTSGLIYNCLTANGFKVVHNRQGANLITGLTTTLINASNLFGQIDCDYLLLEIDEATLPNVSSQSQIDYLVVTNLFRDQLDRFGELDTTKKLIEKGIINSQITLILNADDPNVCQIEARDNKKVFYGLDSANIVNTQTGNQACELAYCKLCNCEIVYHSVFYNQLGNWYCPNCNNKRPLPDVIIASLEAKGIDVQAKAIIDLKEYKLTYSLPGLFNAYNISGCLALSYALNLNIDKTLDGLLKYKPLFGRSEIIHLHNQNIIIQLIKNPAGASLALSSIKPDEIIIIAINDNLADGRDISWLWDTQFELLNHHQNKIIVSGKRLYDMAVRLKHANFDKTKIICLPDLKVAIDEGFKQANGKGNLRILPTYTCLLELQNIFKDLGYKMSGLN